MLKLVLFCLVLFLFIRFSKGLSRWIWFRETIDPQTNKRSSLSNLLWYVKKYDFEK